MPRSRGLRPDADLHRMVDAAVGNVLPARVGAPAAWEATRNRDLWEPPARDQGRSEFCVRFSGCGALEFLRAKEGGSQAPLSPLFAAWNDAMQGDRGLNVGTQIYLFAQAVQAVGVPSEDAHPWELQPDDYLKRMSVRPPASAFSEASRHQVLKSYRLPDGDVGAVVSALKSGFPVQHGGPVDQGYEDVKADGIWRPGGAVLGLHATLAVDLDVVGGSQYVWDRGSWGTGWAKSGYCWVPSSRIAGWRDCRVYVNAEIVK